MQVGDYRRAVMRMSSRAANQLRYLFHLPWWMWGKLAGAAGLATLAILLMMGVVPPAVVVAVLIHVAADFTFQSAETARLKGSSKRHLLVHALVAGGLPLALAGFLTGCPIVAIAGSVIGAIGHYVVDRTRKFGMPRLALGVALDQACHLMLAVILVLLGSSVRLPAH